MRLPKGPARIEPQPRETMMEYIGIRESRCERCLSRICCNVSGSTGLGCLGAFTASLVPSCFKPSPLRLALLDCCPA